MANSSMLAEGKRKKRFCLNPRGTLWSNDENKFGQKLLEKLGWSKGKGLGRFEQGHPEPLKVSANSEQMGIGFKKSENTEHCAAFEDVLSNLNSLNGTSDDDNSLDDSREVQSLEKRSKSSRARVHYHKFTRGKDLSRYSENDLTSVLGTRKSKRNVENKTVSQHVSEDQEEVESHIGQEVKSFGLTSIHGGNFKDYFAKKMSELKQKRAEGLIGCRESLGQDNGELDGSIPNLDFEPERLSFSFNLSQSVVDETVERKSKTKEAGRERKNKKRKCEIQSNDDDAKQEEEVLVAKEAVEANVSECADEEKKKKRKKKYSELPQYETSSVTETEVMNPYHDDEGTEKNKKGSKRKGTMHTDKNEICKEEPSSERGKAKMDFESNIDHVESERAARGKRSAKVITVDDVACQESYGIGELKQEKKKKYSETNVEPSLENSDELGISDKKKKKQKKNAEGDCEFEEKKPKEICDLAPMKRKKKRNVISEDSVSLLGEDKYPEDSALLLKKKSRKHGVDSKSLQSEKDSEPWNMMTDDKSEEASNPSLKKKKRKKKPEVDSEEGYEMGSSSFTSSAQTETAIDTFELDEGVVVENEQNTAKKFNESYCLATNENRSKKRRKEKEENCGERRPLKKMKKLASELSLTDLFKSNSKLIPNTDVEPQQQQLLKGKKPKLSAKESFKALKTDIGGKLKLIKSKYKSTGESETILEVEEEIDSLSCDNYKENISDNKQCESAIADNDETLSGKETTKSASRVNRLEDGSMVDNKQREAAIADNDETLSGKETTKSASRVNRLEDGSMVDNKQREAAIADNDETLSGKETTKSASRVNRLEDGSMVDNKQREAAIADNDETLSGKETTKSASRVNRLEDGSVVVTAPVRLGNSNKTSEACIVNLKELFPGSNLADIDGYDLS